MNTSQILNLLKSDSVLGQIFFGVFPSDLLPEITKFPAALVINLDPSTSPGSHWVAMYFDQNGDCDYFDSYGLQPPLPLLKYMTKNTKSVTYNDMQVQAYMTTTCGQMCIYFLVWRCRGISFSNIVKSMTSDEFVAGFINGLFALNL